ncbi:2-dehydropantoate 2-reductase [Emcibacter sp. SYSU 3D8]|uniref:ketopantoate reductase family protein n=1 Tax=Emcibacter sp. SYSU 3D8 TaxID=3133969 RepID=UPI0031FF3CD4
MKIAIMGSGGVGGYFGAKMALAGHDVTFIARGAHLDAIRKNGLLVKTDTAEMRVDPARATDDPATIGPVDVVLFTTKLYDTSEAAAQLKPVMGPDTYIVTIQNGVSGADLIGEVLGHGKVLPGSTYIISHLEAPGVIRHMGQFQRIVFGEVDGSMSARGRAFEQLCRESDIDVEFSDKVLTTMWEKFIPLTVMSGMTSLLRLPIGPILADPELSAMVDAAVEEAVSVGRAKGVELHEKAASRVQKSVRMAPYDTKASMLIDLERGKKMELPWLSASVARWGEELGVPTPTHKFIAAALKPYAAGAPKA